MVLGIQIHVVMLSEQILWPSELSPSPTPHFKRFWLLRQESEESSGVVSGKEKNRKISGCSRESGWDPTLDIQSGNRRVSPDSF